MKPDGSVRICGDYKVTLNPGLQVPQHPIPRAEECFHAVNGGKKFTKLDLAQAYNQIILDETSKQLTKINTHCGLYCWCRLPFRVAASPAIFQGIMDKVLHGLHHVVWYLDDILISGENDEKHLDNLAEVLSRLEKNGLRRQLSKCQFFQDSVECLGHEISEEGIQPLQKKVLTIKQAPAPKTVDQLESFLGMINYYGKFIPNLSTLAAPLNQLRQKNKPWKWESQEETAFKQLKEALVSTKILVHYDPMLPVKLDCDASSVGTGAVLLHQMKDGTERPIAYASRSLTKAVRNYSQIEREALSTIWGVRKFQLYLYFKRFMLVTDHKPLTILFNPNKAIPVLASARIQRWALFLMDYQYNIQFRRTGKHANADALSRLPIEEKDLVSSGVVSSLQVRQIEDTLITAKQIANSTCKNPLLSKVLHYVKMGWPDQVSTGCSLMLTEKWS